MCDYGQSIIHVIMGFLCDHTNAHKPNDIEFISVQKSLGLRNATSYFRRLINICVSTFERLYMFGCTCERFLGNCNWSPLWPSGGISDWLFREPQVVELILDCLSNIYAIRLEGGTLRISINQNNYVCVGGIHFGFGVNPLNAALFDETAATWSVKVPLRCGVI